MRLRAAEELDLRHDPEVSLIVIIIIIDVFIYSFLSVYIHLYICTHTQTHKVLDVLHFTIQGKYMQD